MPDQNIVKSKAAIKPKEFILWYKWEPSSFLNGVVGLTAAEIGLYVVILNLIYDRQRPIKLDVEGLAKRCSIKPSLCQKHLDALLERGKLIIYQGYIFNRKAIKVINEMIRRNGGETMDFPPENLEAWETKIASREAEMQSELELSLDATRHENDFTRKFLHPLSNKNSGASALEEKRIDNPQTPKGAVGELPAGTPLPDEIVLLPGEVPSASPEVEKAPVPAADPTAAKDAKELTPKQERHKLLSDEFYKQFWPKYPKQEEERGAFRAFAKAREDANLGLIMDGLDRYCRHMHGKDARFLKAPAAWLRNHCWKDKYTSGRFEADNLPAAKVAPRRWDPTVEV